MLCDSPFMAGSIPFGCGNCFHCRRKRARLWAWRQYFESLCHEHSCFVTLTYDDAHLPADKMLEPRVLQLFLKRLRAACDPIKIRFFAVGEYGSLSYRPHYHLSLFGVSGYCGVGSSGHLFSKVVNDCWGRGFTYVAEFNERTAHYVTGYVVKRLADASSGVRFSVPEFARFSLRPGLGFDAMSTVAKQLLRSDVMRCRDVPSQLRVGNVKAQLGRYLLNALREQTGFAPDYAKKFRDGISYERSLEMCSLSANSAELKTFKEAYLEATKQARLSSVARAKIFAKVGNLS